MDRESSLMVEHSPHGVKVPGSFPVSPFTFRVVVLGIKHCKLLLHPPTHGPPNPIITYAFHNAAALKCQHPITLEVNMLNDIKSRAQ